FVPEPLPPVQRYAVLRIRPSDWDDYGNYIEPHCTLHFIDQEKIDAGYEMFLGSVQVRKGQAAYNRIVRREKREAQKNERPVHAVERAGARGIRNAHVTSPGHAASPHVRPLARVRESRSVGTRQTGGRNSMDTRP